MRISRIQVLALGVMASAPAYRALALDATSLPSAIRTAPVFGSAREALRSGVRDYNAGDKAAAVQALEYAATQGHALALWKLGRMYADGDGVPHDDLKAFEYFSKIADQNSEDAPDSQRAPVISSAFVALGTYFLDGIKGTYVAADPVRASEMFAYAASYYGDPNAQYNLARLYLDGVGVDRNVRQAARWFNLAAEKGHHEAQAVLGHLLIKGEGIPRQTARGLMWLTLAKEGADARKESWIIKLYDEAFAKASETDRSTALAYSEEFAAKRH